MLSKTPRGELKLPSIDFHLLDAEQGVRFPPLWVAYGLAASDLGGLYADLAESIIISTEIVSNPTLLMRCA